MADLDRDWGRTALYRLFGDAGDLLYIGISNDPERRWAQHEAVQHWWPLVRRKSVEWYDLRDGAATAECAAIEAELPRFNSTHSKRPRERRIHGAGRRGSATRPGAAKLTVEAMSPSEARHSMPWLTDVARLARWELGELPITYIEDRGVRILAIVPAWLAEWAHANARAILTWIDLDRANTDRGTD